MANISDVNKVSEIKDINHRKELLKNYLNRYNKTKNRIRELEKTHNTILTDSQFPQYSTGYKEFPRVQSSGISEGAASFSLKLSEIEDRIAEQKNQLSNLIIEILDILNYLPPDSEERSLLELKYIQNKRCEDICAALYISRSKYFYLLDKTLNSLLVFKKVNVILEQYQNDMRRYNYV